MLGIARYKDTIMSKKSMVSILRAYNILNGSRREISEVNLLLLKNLEEV